MSTTTTRTSQRPWALHTGLALSTIATLAPLVDVATVDSLANHVRSAYPDWPTDLVSADRNAIVGYLTVVGVLGLAGWLGTAWAVARRKGWAHVAITVMFALGASTALFNFTLSGGAYTNVIPRTYGTLGLLPVIPGLAAVVLAWRHRRHPA
ncbi:hypothetical protein [Streptoalloteichus hindustanus]|uniref:Uncharacterized protein n=1 Tax=Streptoalloteichus hindustanus TaxID=2017 RepID=A0A1M5FK39_STRHI|nr:hypothetical protein [Streptoalloteichus hindustanus]SHF91866.1 hypothetical protein SAMN05444320_105476 [Streptoalloteichus hindustanus]